MKKFRFRLQKVLEYKRSVKEERKGELALANARLKEEEEELASLERAAAGNEVWSRGEFPFTRVHLCGLFGIRILEEIDRQKEAIIEAQEEVDQALERYIEASKEAESLETLLKKRKAEHQELLQKEETNYLDELTVQRMGRVIQESHDS